MDDAATVGMADASDDAYFELSFSPTATLVGTVRRFVGDFYARILDDAEVTSRLAVATHELLENAVRYSNDGTTTIRVGVKRSGDDMRIRIETRNRAAASNVEILRGVLEEITRAEDADQLYQAMMRRSAKRVDGSGLGLGRVCAESGMALTYRIDEDMVYLQASAHVAQRGRVASAPGSQGRQA
jgi:hypothetical protein